MREPNSTANVSQRTARAEDGTHIGLGHKGWVRIRILRGDNLTRLLG